MKKSQLLGTVCAAALLTLSNTSQAALVSEIVGLDIGGTLYDVTFHTGTGDSFMALWDQDNDGVFGGGTSEFSSQPQFWGNSAGASQAAAAIMQRLGTLDWVGDSSGREFYDSFLVPWQVRGCASPWPASDALTTGADCIAAYRDNRWELEVDDAVSDFWPWPETTARADLRYASFQPSAVPVPAAVWLFGSGLLGLIGVARRKKA